MYFCRRLFFDQELLFFILGEEVDDRVAVRVEFCKGPCVFVLGGEVNALVPSSAPGRVSEASMFFLTPS